MPNPPSVRSSERSPCTKRSNTLGSSTAGMPMPVSRTCNTASSSSRLTAMVMRPPSGVYLTALLIRLRTTCDRRVESASTGSSSFGSLSSTACLCASISGRQDSSVRATTLFTSRTSFFSAILPRVIRLTSSRSSTIRARSLVCLSMTPRNSACSRPDLLRIRPSALTMDASGLRSSWASIARNSFICRSLSCSASMRRWTVRSRVTLANPRTRFSLS